MYHSILLKVSGEALSSPNHGTFDPQVFKFLVREIAQVLELGTKVAIVTGAGNIFRARMRETFGIDQVNADTIGMTAIDVNALMLQEVLRSKGIKAQALSAIGGNKFIPEYSKEEAARLFSQGTVVVCGGGTGQPYVTTDSAGVQRAIDLGCEVVLKASNVDGVYDSDPDENPLAKRYDTLSYVQALEEDLQVMDRGAFEMAESHALPIVVYKMTEIGALRRIVQGERIGTLVS